MAKRRTLRRQRDKALKELAFYKQQAIELRNRCAMEMASFDAKVVRLTARFEFTEADMQNGFVDTTCVTRSLIRDLVDEGHFDNIVVANTKSAGQGKMCTEIELHILRTDEQQRKHWLRQMYGMPQFD